MVLRVADVVDVKFEAGGFAAGEAGWGRRVESAVSAFSVTWPILPAAEGEEGRGRPLFWRGRGWVRGRVRHRLFCGVSRSWKVDFAGGEVEIEEEEGVIGDLAEGVVADLVVVEVLGGAGGDAFFEHGEGEGFELGGEGSRGGVWSSRVLCDCGGWSSVERFKGFLITEANNCDGDEEQQHTDEGEGNQHDCSEKVSVENTDDQARDAAEEPEEADDNPDCPKRTIARHPLMYQPADPRIDGCVARCKLLRLGRSSRVVVRIPIRMPAAAVIHAYMGPQRGNVHHGACVRRGE